MFHKFYVEKEYFALQENRKPVQAIKKTLQSSQKNTCLLHKHKWNTRWAFSQKHDNFMSENDKLSSHMKKSLLLWLHNKSYRALFFNTRWEILCLCEAT